MVYLNVLAVQEDQDSTGPIFVSRKQQRVAKETIIVGRHQENVNLSSAGDEK